MRSTTALLWALVIFLLSPHKSICFRAIGLAEVANGKCKYRGVLIEDGRTVWGEHPCESWRCIAKSRTVIIHGCDIQVVGEKCTLLVSPGKFPRCCPRRECPRQK